VASSSLHDAVNEGLEQKWSLEQISARLDEEYLDEPEMRVSPETMYQTLSLPTAELAWAGFWGVPLGRGLGRVSWIF
jgi:IS30 family transposase